MVQQTLVVWSQCEKSEYSADDGVAVVDHIDLQTLEVDNIGTDSRPIPHTEYQKAYDTLDLLLNHLP
ncbi:hypothetical protein [Neobacillus niacini]|uniref:hypothetical protein n=1 Tax=Neobacillus niacini TaxID=86668 RepID=UPI0021CB08E8|nr:hypothetical protein [Neobacillus niacini]MCM3763786.1 hypothetical protein [Neobacillus niacini]